MAKGEARASVASDGAVKDERPFAAVHILATAILCANGASDAELELARRLLEQDPKRAPPRERESVAGAFNRQMDAAIDAADDSAGLPFRAARRAELAAALDRADLVLIDRAMLAAMMVTIGELKAEVASPVLIAFIDDEDLGAELLDDDAGPSCDLRPGGINYVTAAECEAAGGRWHEPTRYSSDVAGTYPTNVND